MRHLKKGRKFGRKKGRRNSFLDGLVSNLIMRGKIKTTEARAKAVRPRIERLISIAKHQNLAALRLLRARIQYAKAAEKLYYEIAPRYEGRNGGYMRIIKTAKPRKRDGAMVAIMEFV